MFMTMTFDMANVENEDKDEKYWQSCFGIAIWL